MSVYPIYFSEGFVCRASPFKERDMVITFLTVEYGLVSAVATGIRAVHSKMRSNTTLYSYGRYEFVRGKDMFRLISTSEIHTPNPLWYSLYERISRMSMLFLEKDIPVPEFSKAVSIFIKEKNQSDYDSFDEAILLYTLLAHLGYRNEEIDSGIVEEIFKTSEKEKSSFEKKILKHIERVMKEV